MATDFLLSWPRIIDISANQTEDIEIIDNQLSHRVRMDVSASYLNTFLTWTRVATSNRPDASWLTPSVLFNAIAGRDVDDLDIAIDLSGNVLNFTSASLAAGFRPDATANKYVIPYVLFRLFRTSAATTTTVPNYTKLVTGSPLLGNTAWANAYALDISNNAGAVDTMFSELLLDTGRFAGLGTETNALYSPESWPGPTVNGNWRIQAGDLIQFTTRFTFAHRIIVKNISTINPDGTTFAPDGEDIPAAIINAGDQFSIRFQLHAV